MPRTKESKGRAREGGIGGGGGAFKGEERYKIGVPRIMFLSSRREM